VSGDCCDLLVVGGAALWFFVGDVTGKGVSAALLMSHLHAMFRTLVTADLPLEGIVERASRALCESTLPTHYATLACGRAGPDGMVEICNAGHPQPLLARAGRVSGVEASGLPIGMFCDQKFGSARFQVDPGDTFLLYTDGVTETQDPAGAEYGAERLGRLLSLRGELDPQGLVEACVADVAAFRASAPKADDLTLMALQRSP
jgi:sigma-B regulation protein RsbU (phosphoserine phosphatase)